MEETVMTPPVGASVWALEMFNELSASLKSESELSADDPVIPRLDLDRVERDDLLEVTHRLLDHEHADAKELKRLRKDLDDMRDTTLWGLLVDVMMRDTEKHISILRFVADHAKPKRSVLHRG